MGTELDIQTQAMIDRDKQAVEEQLWCEVFTETLIRQGHEWAEAVADGAVVTFRKKFRK